MIGLLIFAAVIAILFAPVWPYSRGASYGWYPSGGLGTILLIVLLLYFFGVIHIR